MKDESAVNLTNCDAEPIHIPGAIQPIGCLLALTSDWIIARASTNTAEFIGLKPDELIGQPLSAFASSATVHALRNRAALLHGANAVERMFQCELMHGAQRFDISLHFSGNQTVLEIELSGDATGNDTSSMLRSMMSRLDQCADTTSFLRDGARQVRALLGFDRVMVYRFSENGSGEVVAEACRSGIGRFLGLHYPASDIPAQARELYHRNLLRLIADVHATPVAITPQLDESGLPIDLSLSVLRAVSPIHIEYLKNMGVDASLSISIIVDGKLWGLFACHHYAPFKPTLAQRSVSELFVQMFSMRLEGRQRREVMAFEHHARDIADRLLGAVASDETLLRDPDWLADILTSAIGADGVGVWINGNHAFSGVTPDVDQFRQIVKVLNSTAAGKVFATDHIASIVPGAEDYAAEVAGMLAIPISRSPRDYVILFRPELVHSVRWAGDPNKPVKFGPNGPRLTPRESFSEWKEQVKGHSQPFTSSEMRVAETFRATLIEVVLRLADEASAERQRAHARQELLIAELNHRVRNILSLIRGLIRQSAPDDPAAAKFVKIVDGRVHALARAHNQITDDHWGPAPLRALIDAEARAFADHHSRVIATGEAVLLNPQAYSTMALVIHELVTNSTKYGSLSTNGRVEINWQKNAEGDLVLNWHEVGGPFVQPPTRQGFGTTIIHRSLPYDLGGSSKIDYHSSGVEAVFRIPARHVSEPRSFEGTAIETVRPSTSHKVAPPDNLLAGHNVLLVEDSLIIALDAEDIIGQLGAETVYPSATVDGALDVVDSTPPSLAMLDINLGDRNSFAVADKLKELEIPYLFATGYGEQVQLPDNHKGAALLQKPYTLENVARAFAELTGFSGEK